MKYSLEKTKSFTLVELLTAVAVIAILSGLLFPAIQSARKIAQRAQCASQLSQIYSIINLYAADNNNFYILTAPASFAWSWFSTNSPLATYAGGPGSLERLCICPSNRFSSTDTPLNGTPWYNPYGYAYVANYAVMVISPPSGLFSQAQSLTAVRRPSQTILMMDSVHGAGWAAGLGYWDSSEFSRIGMLHLNKVNALWCDGHVTLEDKTNITSNLPYLTP